MAKQILIGIEEQELSEIAHYLMIYFPYNEEICSYTDAWMGDCMRTNIRWLLKEEDTVYELPWKYECLDDCASPLTKEQYHAIISLVEWQHEEQVKA